MWEEVRRLLEDPARLKEEYARRLRDGEERGHGDAAGLATQLRKLGYRYCERAHEQGILLPTDDDYLRHRADAAIRLQRGLTPELLALVEQALVTPGSEYTRDLGLKTPPDPLPELAASLERFTPLFRRSESRTSLERYVTGLSADLPRKNCDTIASAVAATSTERLRHLLTDADWDPRVLDRARVERLSALSPPDGTLAVDNVGLPKQGARSVAVQRQYCG